VTTNRRALAHRIDELEAEIRRRRSTSEVQAEYAIDNDNREEEVDERDDHELSTSERQVRALTTKRGRGSRRWTEIES